MRQGPLAGRYPAVAAMVLMALLPYLALSGALEAVTPIITEQLHTSAQTMSLGSGLANAAYAVGTVLAVALAQHYPQRRMMVLYTVILVIGSILAAAATSVGAAMRYPMNRRRVIPFAAARALPTSTTGMGPPRVHLDRASLCPGYPRCASY